MGDNRHHVTSHRFPSHRGDKGWQLTIQKRLGEGGQGVAYLASGPGGDLVVKWTNAEQATDAQRQVIRQLVKDGLLGHSPIKPIDPQPNPIQRPGICQEQMAANAE